MPRKVIDTTKDGSRYLLASVYGRLLIRQLAADTLAPSSIPESVAKPEPDPDSPREVLPKRQQRKPITIKDNETPIHVNKVDILVVTALKIEQEQLFSCFDFPGDPQSYWVRKEDEFNLTYYVRKFNFPNKESFIVATVCAPQIGSEATATVATRLAAQLKPMCLAMIGICAGNYKKGIRLGDVIVADEVYDFDFGKYNAYYPNHGSQSEILRDISTYKIARIWFDRVANLDEDFQCSWLESIKNIRPKSFEHQKAWLLHTLYEYRDEISIVSRLVKESNPEWQENCPDWDQVVEQLWKDEFLVDGHLKLTTKGRSFVERELVKDTQTIDYEEPKLYIGSIGTGKHVTRDPKLFDKIERFKSRAPYGFEMEGSAIGAAAVELNISRMIVVKGVSDYGDHRKNDQFHKYAAECSARFLLLFLKEYLFV